MARQPRATPTGVGLVSRLTVLAAALAAASLPISAALAHESVPVGSPGGYHRSQLIEVPAGMTATLLAGRTPAIAVTTEQALVVFGERGEEMARVRGRSIEVNEASATWQVTAESRGERPGPGWRTLNDGLFTWLEPRARPVASDRGTRPWRVPLTLDGRTTALTGETRWIPPSAPEESGSSSSARTYGIAAVVLAALALVVIQRRRSAAAGGLGSADRS